MSKKIIVADDNRTFLMYAGLLLKRFDFKVLPAENGMEALKLLRLTEPDVVLLDIYMSGMDGYTVLRKIKNDKQTAHIPVIMVSTDSSIETVNKCMELGCFDYLAKPLKIDKLHNMLQKCFYAHKGTNRLHLRALFNKKVMVTYDDKKYELYAETISEGGIYIRKEKPFPEGVEVSIKCDLEDRGPIQLKGNVIYTEKLFGNFMTHPPGMAIYFKELTEEDAKALKLYIEDLVAKDILDGQEEKIIER
jgi:CheY-like chemotaxis protein/Tfp pilus assembly protein PilZ